MRKGPDVLIAPQCFFTYYCRSYCFISNWFIRHWTCRAVLTIFNMLLWANFHWGIGCTGGIAALLLPEALILGKAANPCPPHPLLLNTSASSSDSEEIASLVFETTLKRGQRHSCSIWKEKNRYLEPTCPYGGSVDWAFRNCQIYKKNMSYCNGQFVNVLQDISCYIY